MSAVTQDVPTIKETTVAENEELRRFGHEARAMLEKMTRERQHDRTFFLPTVIVGNHLKIDCQGGLLRASGLLFEHSAITEQYVPPDPAWKAGLFRYTLVVMSKQRKPGAELLVDDSRHMTIKISKSVDKPASAYRLAEHYRELAVMVLQSCTVTNTLDDLSPSLFP